MTPPGKASLRRALLPAVIFALALAVRLHYLAGVEAYPRFEHVKNRLDDQVVFHLWASAIVAGERFDYATTGHEFAYWAAQHPGVYPQAPLYPFFVAACYRIFGSDFDLVRVVQMVLGAAACALFYLLARRWLTPVPAVLAALGLAFYGPGIFYEGTFLRAGLFIPAAVAGLYLLCLAAEAAAIRRRWLAAAAGLALSAGVLLRPNYLLVAALAAAWLYRSWSRMDGAWEARRSLVLFAAGLVLPLLPVSAVNSARSGSLAFLSCNGPYIFFIGNVHDASGTSAGYSPTYLEVKASGPPGEVDLVAATLADVVRHPGAFLRLQLRKAVAFFAPGEIPNNLSYAMARETNPRLAAGFLQFHHLLPLAAAGLLASLARPRRHLPLYLFLAGYWAGTVAFYVLSRLRQPVVPVLLIFAGLALDAWWRALRRRPAVATGAAVAVLAATAFLWPLPVVHRPTDYQMAAAAEVSLAEERDAAGRTDEAHRRYARALALNPEHGVALARLAASGVETPAPGPEILALCEDARRASEAGDLQAARRLLEEASVLTPESALPHHYLGNVHFLAGDPRRAMRAFEKAVERAPLNEIYRSNLKRLRQEVAARYST